MKSFKAILTLGLLLVSLTGFSQQLSEKQKEKEKNKVYLFNSEEKDNLQQFYAEEVDKMKLSEEKRAEYYDVLLSHTYDMARLDDKDKDYSVDEIDKKFNILQDKMNVKMKTLLTAEQYVMHLETFSKIMYSVNRKKNLGKN